MTERETKMLKAYLHHQSYMKAYSKRPSVKAKRSSYNKERWAMMKAAAQIAKDSGLIK